MNELEATITERRRQTRNSIYRCLYRASEPCTKQTLARDLSLSLPTVYQNLNELIDAGLVRYSGKKQSTGGRNPQTLDIAADARCSVGISITDHFLRLVVIDLRMNVVAGKKISHLFAGQMEDLGQFLCRELERFLEENRIDRSRILGVGIAIPGVLDPASAEITFSPTLKLKHISLAGLKECIPYPTYIDNDATSGGYAEWHFRGLQQNMAYLSLESGVGGAVIINGALYQGQNHRAGEFGHSVVEPGGKACTCGKCGCLEAYCSARRISDDLGITLDEFFAGVRNHDSVYEPIWEDLLRHLAVGIGNIRMMLDCDVVLGGFLTQYMGPYLPQLRAYTAAYNTFEPDADYLCLGCHPRHAVVIGVAMHFINDFIESL